MSTLAFVLYVIAGTFAGVAIAYGGARLVEWILDRRDRKAEDVSAVSYTSAWWSSPPPTTNVTLTADLSKFKKAIEDMQGRGEVPTEKRSEPIVGWRFWSFNWQTLILKAHDDWVGPEKVAYHVTRSDGLIWPMMGANDHIKSPHPGCMCGINALKAEGVYPYLTENIGHRFTVVGRVELTGTVDEYERGYRAEKGRIIELVILAEQVGSRVLDKLEERYGVRPTVQKPEDWLEEMEVIYGLGEAYQETRSGAGALAALGRAYGATSQGTRASQDRSLSSYRASLKGMGFTIGTAKSICPPGTDS